MLIHNYKTSSKSTEGTKGKFKNTDGTFRIGMHHP